MSFGTAESMNHHHQQYQAMSQGGQAMSARAYDRKSGSMSDIYPPPMASTIQELEPSITSTMEHQAAISGPGIPQATYAQWQQPYAYPKQADSYGSWYADGGPQHVSPEEHVQQSTDAGQPGTAMYYHGR
jgi:hypothetical protein